MASATYHYDAMSCKFTGKERDTESGLDNFGARYNSSSFGRFMSPDSSSHQASNIPQSWNLYSYVQNNPTNAVDPDGHDCVYLNDAGTAVEVVNGVAQIDHNSTEVTCNETGGRWANGTVEAAWWVKTDPDSDTVRIFSHYKDIVGTTFAGPGWSHGDKYAKDWIPYAQARDEFLARDDGFQWAAWNLFFHSNLGAGASDEDDTPASTPVGRRGSNMSVAPGRPNTGTTIMGRYYTGHALDQLQGRGMTPTVVEEIIANGTPSPGDRPNTAGHSAQGITIITNQTGDVVTVMYSRK